MSQKSPLQWWKILLFAAASPPIGIVITWLGAIALHALLSGDDTTGIFIFYILMIAVVPVTAAVALTLPLAFVRERRRAHSLTTVAVAAPLFVLMVWWFLSYYG
jgi:hypothetical protein